MRWLDSPQSFAKATARLGVALVIVGVVGLVDRWYALPFAGLLLAVAAVAWLAGSEALDDPAPVTEVPDPAPPPVPPPVPGSQGVRRTFRLPGSVGADAVWLVGDFNDWSCTAHPMPRDADGFRITIELEPGRTYRYRYLLDADRWENDWAADGYAPNPYGSEDSLVRT